MTQTTCPTCHAPVLPDERFCEACGAALTGVRAPGPPPPRVPAHDGANASPAPEVPLTRCGTCGELAAMNDGYCSICGMRAPVARDHREAQGAGWAGVSDRGHHHARNEDAFAVGAAGPQVVVAVADGVSTTQRPDDASQACVDAALAVLAADPAAIEAAAAAARDAVLGLEHQADPDLGPPSCTLLLAALGTTIELGWLGDCRAYWIDGATTEVLTTDHSWAAEEVAAGRRSEADAMGDPRAHMITRWVGADADAGWRPARRSFTPRGPGHLLLCSDGLWNYLADPAELRAVAGELPDLLAAANRLVAFANDAGGQDNITVVLAAWPAAPAPDPAAPPAPEGAR